jgi:hypothetical protein
VRYIKFQEMFKLKKTLNADLNKFIGIKFFYEDIDYEITEFGSHPDIDDLCFFLDGLKTRLIKMKSFHKNVEVGKFKIIRNVGV